MKKYSVGHATYMEIQRVITLGRWTFRRAVTINGFDERSLVWNISSASISTDLLRILSIFGVISELQHQFYFCFFLVLITVLLNDMLIIGLPVLFRKHLTSVEIKTFSTCVMVNERNSLKLYIKKINQTKVTFICWPTQFSAWIGRSWF